MGRIRNIIEVLKNISYFKEVENKLDQAKRALRSRNRFADILAKATHERQALEEMCQVLVLETGYDLAWVGLIEEGGQQRLIPIAQYGFDEGDLKRLHHTLASSSPENGSMVRAIQRGIPFIVHDLQKNTYSFPWQESAKMKGYASSIAIPMGMRSKPFGVLNLYTTQCKRFDDFENEWLSELANLMADGILRIREIANHYRMEQAIKEIEHRFKDVFNVMDRGLVIYDVLNNGENFVIKNMNKAGAKIINVVAHNVIGRCVTDAFPRGCDFDLFAVLQQVHRTGEPTYYSTSYTNNNNQHGWLENFIYKLESGEIVAICSDLTEKRRTENRLRLAHASLENITDMVFWVRPDGSFSLVNQAARHCLGYSQKELLTMSVTDLNPDHPPNFWLLHWEELKKNRTLVFEALMQRKLAPPLPVEISANYLAFENQEFNVAIVRDISLRKQTENILLQSEHMLRDLYENAPVAFMSVDAQSGRIIRCNNASHELFGYDCHEIHEVTIYDLCDNISTEQFVNGEVLQLLSINVCVKDQEVLLTWISLKFFMPIYFFVAYSFPLYVLVTKRINPTKFSRSYGHF